MYLTQPQSSHFQASRFDGVSPRENHFDWALYYRFKDERESFWRRKLEDDQRFQALAAEHFAAFKASVDATLALLDTDAPHVLDVGLSSEQLDRAILRNTRGTLTVLDVESEAARSFEAAFGERGHFVLGDVIAFAREPGRRGTFDLVYSVGLIEHFPDKTDIVGAHVALTKPGGVVLFYVPRDSPANRGLVNLAAEWENFGHRELLAPEELRDAAAHPELDVVRVEPVGFFSAVWSRRRHES